MPQKSYAYANGRLSVIGQRMLGGAFLNRLMESSEADAIKLLREANYGSGAGNANDVEQLIAAELAASRALVWELTPEPEVVKLFLLRTDAHNLKTLLKAKLFGIQAGELMAEGGAFPLTLLQKAVDEGDLSELPAQFAQAIEEAESIAQKSGDPGLVSAAVDRAVFEYIGVSLKKRGNAFAKRYFSAQADFINVESLIRARALNWREDRLIPMLVFGGEIPKDTILSCLEVPVEQLAVRLNRGQFGPAIAKALGEYAQTGSLKGLERSMDRALMEMVRAEKNDILGMGPILGYLLGREAEARAIRVIFAAKLAKSTPELPELYV
ncbi:MAG: V-type ATPase subunit [Christensenellales bacterium]|jgi:V/A-type H+-transporting ATPase subunit C